eukprot:scaffold86932_cov52-Phaeocystis_antarctica.AAC.2
MQPYVSSPAAGELIRVRVSPHPHPNSNSNSAPTPNPNPNSNPTQPPASAPERRGGSPAADRMVERTVPA